MKYLNYVDGRWCDGTSGRRFSVWNPADLRASCHEYPLSGLEDADKAVCGAHEAFERWRREPLRVRVRVLRSAAKIIVERREEIARIITSENGKLLSESLSEIDAAVVELNYQIGEGERLFGKTGDCFHNEIFAYSRREPIGVVSIIVPWNFPFNVPWRKLAPALLGGNTVILKPASQTPGVGEVITQILIDAGIPQGVVQFITGSGAELSNALVAHPLVRAVTFTGSTEVGKKIAELAARNLTRTQLEMGGKNPMVVLADADLELAAKDAVIGAFSCAGQWCTATSRLIVDSDVADSLMESLLRRTSELRLGAGLNPKSTMGPVAGRAQLNSVLRHIERAREQGAYFAAGGRRAEGEGLAHGSFVEPSVIDNPSEVMDVGTTEVFGPVLTVHRVSGYEEALQLANAIPFGLSSSIYTRDLESAIHFAEHSEVGLTHINVHSAYKEPQYSFGGVKQSGFGLPEAGATGIQFFLDEKVVYMKKRAS